MRSVLRNGRRFFGVTSAVVCVATFLVGISLPTLKATFKATKPNLKSTISLTPRVVRHTDALEVAEVGAGPGGSLRVVVKNVSERNINGFVVISGGAEITVDVSSGDRVIAPQATQDFPLVANPDAEITLTAVMFADGGVEGEERKVAQIKLQRAALKRELKRGLEALRDVIASADAGSPAIFEKMESAIFNLQTERSSPPEATGSLDARRDLVSDIHEVRARQQYNGYREQHEHLKELCDRIERRIASL